MPAIDTVKRRELMAARIVESDLDLAFRLQLEEAMAASLTLQPSSSTSPPRSGLPQPPGCIGAANLARLQTDELDNFERLVRDHLYMLSEKKKIQEDHLRGIHDQKLAHEILHVPEEQWRVTGDYIQRPYGEGTSSSQNEENSEVFRVYFKGLLSEERILGTSSSQRTITLAGIGVAICDSRDTLVFETKKPLELMKDERMSRQIVEGKALIEALQAAIDLDLQRIEFYCDYFTLYQNVIGRWRPKQLKMRTFLNEVNRLRTNFKSSTPLFVARNDIKFAFKLAREAIVSQLNNPIIHEMLENCPICLEDKPFDQFFSVESCKHRYCFSCMKQHVEVKLLHGILPKCPNEECKFDLKLESCQIFMTPKLIEMMKLRLKEASIPVTDKVYCPYPKCSALMSKTDLRPPRSIHGNGERTCYKCHGNFCMNCRVPWHKNMNCAEYKRRNPTPLVEESELKNLAARNLWRQCIKCNHMIELAAGCYHMTCRCGYEFCYTCGAEWKEKKATCTCPLWDEENILDNEDEDDDFDDDDDDDGDYAYPDDGDDGDYAYDYENQLFIY